MSVNATPAVQVTLSGPSFDAPSAPPLETGGLPLYCPNGATGQAATLPAATAGLPLNFPVGVATAVFIFIAADTTTDLIVTVGSFALPVPRGQGIVLYGIASNQISLGSVLGGQIRYAVGG